MVWYNQIQLVNSAFTEMKGIKKVFEISFIHVFIFISIVWVLIRTLSSFKNKNIDWKRECLLLTVYICIVVVARIVYFPWHLEDGHIGTLKFNAEKILPLWINFRPFVFLHERYDGWLRNIYGNIGMFIPVGICWGLCFKQLNSVLKVTFAGFIFSFLIELSQLFFYERGSDIDDLMLNTVGALIGALVYFAVARLTREFKKNH